MKLTNILVALIFLSALPLLTACEKSSWSKKSSINAPAPSAKKKWVRRKTFQTAKLGNLAMQFNGEKIFLVARDFEKSDATNREIILAINDNGEAVGDLEIKGRVKDLSVSGSGNHVLAQLEDGSIFLIEGFDEKEKRFDLGKADDAVLSPTGQFIVLKKDGSYSAVSSDGKELWRYPAGVEQIIFPFLNNPDSSFIASAGSVAFWVGGNEIWKRNITGSPVALSSSFLEGGLLAVATAGEKGEIHFFNDKGEELGSVPFSGGAKSLSCSRLGNLCAAYGNGKNGQVVAVFKSDGTDVWSHAVKGEASRDSRVVFTGKGIAKQTSARNSKNTPAKENMFSVIAGFEAEGIHSLRAWDEKGNPLWYIPVEEEILGYEVSWNAKKLNILTERSIEYFTW